MFLRRLAFAVGRLDFWNIKREITPFQLAVHRAAWDLEPMGEDRSDRRVARTTLAIIQSMQTRPMTAESYELASEWLANYLPIHQRKKDENVTPEQAAKIANKPRMTENS